MQLRYLGAFRASGVVRFSLAGKDYVVDGSRSVDVPDEWALGLIETGNFEQVTASPVLSALVEGCPDDEPAPVVKKGRKAKQA